MSQLRSLSGVLAVSAIVGGLTIGAPPVAVADPGVSQEARAADLIKPAVVYIETKITGTVIDHDQALNDGAPFQETLRCTGFAITSDGYLGTAGHCVDPNENRKAIILSAARQLAGVETVSVGDLERLGAQNWTIEGKVPGAGPDQEILVSGAGQRGDVKPIPARVVSFRPLGQGDVALLKVELNEQAIPTAQVPLDSSPQVGDPVLAVGYPDSTQKVTDFSLDPTVKSGSISAKQTWKTQPLFQVSAPMTKGMSGGPTVDMQGRVIGINSFMPSNEDQPFNFISPATGLKELLGQAGVTPAVSPADTAYREGLDDLYAGKYTDAISNFDTALALSHQYPGVLDKRTEAVKLRAERGDASSGPKPWLLVVAGLGVVAVIAGGVLAFVLMRRNREPALAGGGALPQQQAAPAAGGQGPVGRPAAPSAPAGGAPIAPAPGGVQANCKNCGFGMDAGIRFCPRCGKPQG
jgi:serine protease Do